MSWMDSWSRPGKSQATPAPYYLLPGGDATLYCHTCGRVVSSRKSNSKASQSSTPPKYCSQRCRQNKPGELGQRIESAFVALLEGTETTTDPAKPTSTPKKKVKGDPRRLIACSDAERAVFGDRFDPEKVFGRNKNRRRRGVPDGEEWKSVDMDEAASLGSISDEEIGGVSLKENTYKAFAGKQRPSQEKAEVNGSIGGEKGLAEKIEETPEMLVRRREGQRKAEEAEMVKAAARRGVIFGFQIGEGEERRKCEAVMQGKVVEPSFAKGDWSVRWRED